MKSYNSIYVVYPQDPSVDFLTPVFDKLISSLTNLTIFKPKENELLRSIPDDTDLVFFLGHGNTNELLNINGRGEKVKLIDVQNGALQFDECSVILFSCNSVDYLKKVRSQEGVELNNFFVFGDMPTDKEHIEHNQKFREGFWSDYSLDHLEFYKSTLVESLSYGISNAISTDSFHGMFKGICLIVNKKINEVLFRDEWSKNEKLQLIERLVEFKNEIRYLDKY
ncbi:hypothetical protein MY04_3188 [Flammeovirga sp. MY04]|uniref:hypothetical protein n=1 Tax=Flammeovirga sp. MY04 TaxID=1191459 RepID=UPI00080641E9|nr:hypothetical protein [Flammeovirga sp. MY04]ANQ50553.1 hypothetical protein MY04_3188 [Flammeovirga sp. MY04]